MYEHITYIAMYQEDYISADKYSINKEVTVIKGKVWFIWVSGFATLIFLEFKFWRSGESLRNKVPKILAFTKNNNNKKKNFIKVLLTHGSH